jgi:hypothetical protein
MKPLALIPAERVVSLMDPAQVAVDALASSSRHFNNPHQQSSQKSVSRPRMCQSGRLEGCGTPQTAFAAPQRPSVPGHVRKFVFRGFGYVLVWGCFFD